GQIGLHEWRAAGRPVDEFQRIDRNQDGFITTNEVRYFLAQSEQRRDGSGLPIGGALGRVPLGQTANSTPPQSAPTAATPHRPVSTSTDRSSPQPTAAKPQSSARTLSAAPPAVAAPTIDALATTPLPLT